MIVFIDTNILVSAILNENGKPYQAFLKAVSYPYRGVICEQNIDELNRVFRKKFPAKLQALSRFFDVALLSISVVPIPTTRIEGEQLVRDPADRPILRAAIGANADILLTGDRDFIEAKLERPKIVTVQEFLDMR